MEEEKKQEQKMMYAVMVLRTDQQHISVLESDNYDECYKLWEKLTKQWSDCAREAVPFELTSPVVTSFSPGLIVEISVVPVLPQAMQDKAHNPYYQAMMQKGFANTAGQTGAPNDMLDSGYRRD